MSVNLRGRMLGLALGLLLAACAPLQALPVVNQVTPTQPRRLPTALPETMDCVLVASDETPGPTEVSLFPGPTDQDWSTGPVDAAVTIVEYTDLQVPAAVLLDQNLSALTEKYPQDIRRVFRAYPLTSNDKSAAAALAAEAAGRQNKFWEMARLLVDRQTDWTGLTRTQFAGWVLERATELGMDVALYQKDLTDSALVGKLAKEQDFGLQSGIPVSPFVLINGKVYQGPRDLRSLDSMIRLLVLEKRQFTSCPPFVIDPDKQYLATLQTSQGEVVLQLFSSQAPLAVNNFVYLARQGWFDNNIFHRVLPGYLVQSGDPSGSGFGGPGYAFPNENSALTFDRAGLLATANNGPDSNGSQFFITYQADSELNGKYTIFGEVIQGMDVLQKLTPRDPSQSENLPEGDKILSVKITQK